MKPVLKKYHLYVFGLLAGLIFYYFILPTTLFDEPYSTVLEDRNGILLGASIASDGQWRFPEHREVPDKFKKALMLFEDKRFESHPGLDLLALGRAMKQNVQAKKIVSGGSTITMQVIRLSRKNKARTVLEKLIEITLATRLEWKFDKDEILSLYASHAPFGGNVVGLETACWRYFNRPPSAISWAEATVLAVLPNNPSLIHLGKNRMQLLAKRNRLLLRLHEHQFIDQTTYELAREEPLPETPLPIPRLAPHLLDRIVKEGYSQEKVTSTVDYDLQEEIIQIITDHQKKLSGNGIFNSAALIADVKTGNILAYVGNSSTGPDHGEQVDVIAAPRSTGSILKPFLFAAMLDEGKILSKTIVPDVPTVINGFSPKNFSKAYDGAVPADQALIRSLNIPAVYELQDYRYEKFFEVLKNTGMTTLTQPPDHYGLSLILGGAEGTLWDITGMYASMARTLNNYFERPGVNRYSKNDFHSLSYVNQNMDSESLEKNSWLSASSIWLTFDALKELYRPGEETGWKNFNSSKTVAWKTGTSFGFRDGWAVGINAKHAVGVWVGNADGEGRPGLTGTETAAPILFEIFSKLKGDQWFSQPSIEMTQVETCKESGQRASEYCETKMNSWITKAGLQSDACEFHRRVHLTMNGKFRVNSSCAESNTIQPVNWYVLPAVQEYYYKARNVSYKTLPPYKKDCQNTSVLASMDVIYPRVNSSIFVPRELDGTVSSTVFQVAHRIPASIIFWHLDGVYIGRTQKNHKISITPKEGAHVLTLIDDKGEVFERSFRVTSSSGSF